MMKKNEKQKHDEKKSEKMNEQENKNKNSVPQSESEKEPKKEKETEPVSEDVEKETEENEPTVPQEKYDELNTRLLRLAAEYDNYRKRTQSEMDGRYSDAVVSVVSSFLPLLDNLERAISFEPENKGVQMLQKQLLEIFDKLEVKEIPSDGKPFDPNFHNAIMHEEDAEKAENIVGQTFQKGYMIQDKVIRHAMVKVIN